ncbi:hypothetical protein D3C81_1431530 [compost metagenome]
MAYQLHAADTQLLLGDTPQCVVHALHGFRAHVPAGVAVEIKQHVGGKRHVLRRRRQALTRQRLSLIGQILGHLDVWLGVAPLLLVELVAGMHQLHFTAGHFLLRALESRRAMDELQPLPQIGTQVLGVVHQRRVGRHR